MIFVFLDDQTLDVVSETEDFCGRYEGIDVEDGAYAFFDNNLRKMVPCFTQPNERTTILGGFLGVVHSGIYRLEAAEVDRSDFFARLSKVVFVNPNGWFKTVEEVRKFAGETK